MVAGGRGGACAALRGRKSRGVRGMGTRQRAGELAWRTGRGPATEKMSDDGGAHASVQLKRFRDAAQRLASAEKMRLVKQQKLVDYAAKSKTQARLSYFFQPPAHSLLPVVLAPRA